jgi:hypothetical protein
MTKSYFYLVLFFCGLACSKISNEGKDSQNFSETSGINLVYTDSSHYRPDKDIILQIKGMDDQHMILINLFKVTAGEIELIQSFDSLDSQFGDVEPIFEDFNQDGFVDIKIKCGTGARGANELYHLLTQDMETGKLTYIKGSSSIPNIYFDTERKSITGVYYYNGTSFIDYKIEKDTLVEISGVDISTDDTWTYREYYIYNGQGSRILIRKDSIRDHGEGLYSRE